MTALIECVPNFSEGKNTVTIDALVDVIQAISGLSFLDRQSDADHHRSVLTFAGRPDAVETAAFELIKLAKELIDLRQHQGVHPRIGATDVIPFVPLKPADIDTCIALAKKVGARISTELGIPVFLYEQASMEAHRALEGIRMGALEGLTERMQNDSKWTPDFGEPFPHPTAGVTAIGVRPVLVAFNVNLASDDLAIAKTIARTIRASNGGFKHVKAMGLRLESRGIVQVSMNLTNILVTPLQQVFQTVKSEAAKYSVDIVGSQIVGLVPEGVIEPIDGVELQLENFKADQIIERRLAMLSGHL